MLTKSVCAYRSIIPRSRSIPVHGIPLRPATCRASFFFTARLRFATVAPGGTWAIATAESKVGAEGSADQESLDPTSIYVKQLAQLLTTALASVLPRYTFRSEPSFATLIDLRASAVPSRPVSL